MSLFSNGVSQAAEERLALFIEECGEAIQAATKILRHGFESTNPDDQVRATNREQLEHEFGHIGYAVELLARESDINMGSTLAAKVRKAKSISKWLHFNKGG